MNELTCKECGVELPEGATVCPECGSPVENNVSTPYEVPKVQYCTKCGNQIAENQAFCPNCGTKAVGSTEKPKGKKKVIIPVICIVAIAIAAVLTVLFTQPKVDSITISDTAVQISPNETFQATYTIAPVKSAKAKTKWKSDNETVATVTDTGLITAVSDGTANITVTAKDKIATISVTVKSGPDFNAVCKKIGGTSSYVELASDGSYLKIDTNPSDTKYGDSYDIVDKIKQANKELGLPDSIYTKMLETSGGDGRQTDTYNGVRVTWKYYSGYGLEVMYEAE